jgi:cytochrome c peroxidase
MPPADQIAAGKKVFSDAGCLECHDGPRGSGKRIYGYDEVGTDSQMKYWLDADQDGQACCNFQLDPTDTSLNRGVKSPRLVGLWTAQRFLHNGSVDSLDDLLCLNGPRGNITTPAYGNGGHTFGCELPREDKYKLLAFLLSH